MPQEFHVVRCYACHVFQVQQLKKISKWVCKMCGEKQSLKKEYGRGSGPVCRRHVQKLNMMAGEAGHTGRGERDSFPEIHSSNLLRGTSVDDDDCRTPTEYRWVSGFDSAKPDASGSRWRAFVADDDDDDDNIEEISTPAEKSLPQLCNAEITLSRPIDQGRGGRKYSGWKSGRKRKRDHFNQDIDDASSGSPQSAVNYNSKTSGYLDQENSLPSPPKSLPYARETRQQFSNVADTSRVRARKAQAERGASGQTWSRNDDAEERVARGSSKTRLPAQNGSNGHSKWGQFLQDSENGTDDEREDIADNRGLEESGCSTNSKWGHYLQDSEDIVKDETADVIGNREFSSTASDKRGQFLQESEDALDEANGDVLHNRRHSPEAISQFRDACTRRAVVHTTAILRGRHITAHQCHHIEDLTDNRGPVTKDTAVTVPCTKDRKQTEDTSNPYSQLNSTQFPSNRQFTINPNQPVLSHRTKEEGNENNAKTHENKSYLQTELLKHVFSLEDEGILDEVFCENW